PVSSPPAQLQSRSSACGEGTLHRKAPGMALLWQAAEPPPGQVGLVEIVRVAGFCDPVPRPSPPIRSHSSHGGPRRRESPAEKRAFTRCRLDFSARIPPYLRSEEHTSELQSREHLVCRLLPQ